MFKLRTPLLAAGAALGLTGAAVAASNDAHVLTVNLPDGSVAHVRYTGDVAPQVRIQPVMTAYAASPFAAMDAVFADMERQQAMMMQQAAAMQQAVLAQAGAARAAAAQKAVAGDEVTRTQLPGGMVLIRSGQPAANVSFHYVSTTTSANGCTQTVEYRSDGSQAQPQLLQTSAGTCNSAHGAKPLTVSAVKPAAPQPDQAGKTV